MDRPNVLLVMTDQERYPPPYESEAARRYRRDQMPARERLRTHGIEFRRHYTAATACAPSRASLFTGQYPSLHGVRSTDGLAKGAFDPAMVWLDPDTVPTMGDWFRAAGYRTEYRGKWHISHASLPVAGTHVALKVNDRDGNIRPDALAAYRRADRLAGFGFRGWIGREPHGADAADTGYVRDALFADQVTELFHTLQADRSTPWLAVASLVNPHDIAFSGTGWQMLGFPEPTGDVPDPGAAPSQTDDFSGRPRCQEQYLATWPAMLYEQPADAAYRRFYLWLHAIVDRAIERILDSLEASGMAEQTIVVFTSDHGEMLGAHGGLQQKWYNAFDETVRVPLFVSGPGIEPGTIDQPTSHTDLLPTLLGLIGADPAQLANRVSEHHSETQPLTGRDLSAAIAGGAAPQEPVYFMSEDQITRGLRETNLFTNEPFDAVAEPANVESVVAPVTEDGRTRLWKLNRYYDRLDGSAGEEWELHDLGNDPEERVNRAATDRRVRDQMTVVLDLERSRCRRRPRVTNS